MTYPLSRYDMKNIGEPTRENVSAWIDTHSGDFQNIVDFRAIVGEVELPWGAEESEMAFLDLTCGEEE
jgi:hypothetical protein